VISGWIVIILGILSMVIGVLMALPQKDMKKLMAFHAVSQTGYMLLGLGVGLAALGNSDAVTSFGITAMNGALFHIVNHALYKGLLFLTAGVIFYRLGTTYMNDMGGLAKKMPYTTIFFLIGSFAIAGIPPFNGFASKYLIYESVFKFNPLLSIIAMVVSALTLASFMKVFYSVFLRIPNSGIRDVSEAPKLMLIGMGIMAILIIFMGLFPGVIIQNFIEPASQALISQAQYVSVVIP
jgi:multicomponent Na+:H+ antiporter subunit D